VDIARGRAAFAGGDDGHAAIHSKRYCAGAGSEKQLEAEKLGVFEIAELAAGIAQEKLGN